MPRSIFSDPKRGERANQILLVTLLIIFAFLSLVPAIMMVIMSLRKSVAIVTDYWALPFPIEWGNYQQAFHELIQPALVSFFVAGASTLGVIAVSLLAGYAFAKLRFPGKEWIFSMILVLLFIPGILMLTPNYVLALRLGLRDSFWGLWFFYVAHGQVVAIFLIRTFIQSLPPALFDSARIDGASELRIIRHLVMPLCRPILVTVGMLSFLNFYNDLIWPLLIINNPEMEPMMVAILRFNPVAEELTSIPQLGTQAAGYVVASIPILLVFWFGMKAYIRGVTAGAIKG